MKRTFSVMIATLAITAAVMPAGADPAARRDPVQLFAQAANRYVPHEIGKPVELSYVFGPYVIPPGQDSNRITVDLPLSTGFITAIAPDLVDASSGRIPTQQEAHIHHAHWFRTTSDPNEEYYTTGLSWVFGTGEEKTQGRLDDRARFDRAAGRNWDYGIHVEGETPQTMIYMIHNKLPTVGNYLVVLDVTFIPGTREQIKAATGRDIHPLYGQLWGQTKDVKHDSKGIGAQWTVTRDGTAIAMASHLHPGGKLSVVSNLGKRIDTDADGKPDTPACLASSDPDPDDDGLPGVSLLNSYKYDRIMEAWPYSENYQMGATKFGWRAPVHAGDVLEQRASYALDAGQPAGLLDTLSRDNLDHHWYEAMTYTGIYMDREQAPGTPAGVCTAEALAPRLLGQDTFEEQGLSTSWTDGAGNVKADLTAGVAEVQEDYNLFLDDTPTTHERTIQGMVNHIWRGDPEPLCAQENVPELASLGYGTCGPAEIETSQGPLVDTIHVAGFVFAPGDLNVGEAPLVPRVQQGSTLTFVNEDAAANIRHTFTSCAWPCVGTYVSNFPLPTGGPTAFDTGKIGNLDPIDGGLQVDRVITGQETDTMPLYKMSIAADRFPVGKYSYFCRIHPFMRGAFEVVPAA